MNIVRTIPLMICLTQPSVLLADGAREARRSYVGIWAGERMLCASPARSLHVFGPTRTRHPAIFESSVGYACTVRSVRGSWPTWTAQLNCQAHQSGKRPVALDATQTLTLLPGGKWLRLTMRSARGEDLWVDDLIWCRALPIRKRMTSQS